MKFSMKQYIGGFSIGALTSLLGYPILSDTGFCMKNFMILMFLELIWFCLTDESND